MRLYFRYVGILLKSQMQYRTSFWLMSFGQFFVPFFVFAGMYLLFEQFGQIKGWSFFEVALIFGVIHMAFSISECFIRGFDSFSGLVVNGDFDRILLRPRTTVLQVLGSKFEFSRVGRLLQSLLVLVWAVWRLPVDWTPLKCMVLLLMILSGISIFSGIFILAATMCFWTIQGLEVANIFTDGGREMAQYPMNIYQKNLVRFFTFIIPFACSNYYPLLYILDRSGSFAGSLAYILAPLWGIAFLLPCLLVWQIGVRHYRSTGS
jgi:ABC-2 type transport system permease protein